MLIGVISFSQFRIEAQEVWSQFKFQEMYLYGQINEPLDPGTKVFREVFPKSFEAFCRYNLHCSCHNRENSLYS